MSPLREQIRAEEELTRKLDQYVGQWVAVCDHEVVDHADTFVELSDETDGKAIDGLFRVVAERGAICFF